MIVSLICAVARNGIIGRGNQLPWTLPNDLKRFKALTMGHPVIMGRKTFESLGRPLPGRINIILTHQPGYCAEARGDASARVSHRAQGCRVVTSLEEALEACRRELEVFVIGGANLYAQALTRAHRIYWTEVHHAAEGDVRMPPVDRAAWREPAREDHPADAAHPYAYSFVTLEKR